MDIVCNIILRKWNIVVEVLKKVSRYIIYSTLKYPGGIWFIQLMMAQVEAIGHHDQYIESDAV